MTIIWWLYTEVEKGEVNALPIVMPNTKTEEPGYARAWNMQHFSICTHSIPIHYKTELIIIPLLHMEPPLLCWISYLQVLPQWKLSQSLPQLPKVRVQEDRLILQTTRNEGDWYKHWAWHCVYCMCTWELFVQNLDDVMCILVHICVLQWLLLQQAKLISLFYNALILYLTSREMQCSYFTPLSVYHFMHGIYGGSSPCHCVCEQPWMYPGACTHAHNVVVTHVKVKLRVYDLVISLYLGR